MSNSRKILIVTALLIAAGGICAFAITANSWAGTGAGSCTLQTTGPTPKVIYPWQKWNGSIQGNVFSGVWTDNRGNRGTFKGTMGISVPEVGICTGTWTFGNSNMGKFTMRFDTIKRTCQGDWSGTSSITSQCTGTMKGSRVN